MSTGIYIRTKKTRETHSRLNKGEGNPNHKLTIDEVIYIRNSESSAKYLATRYNLNRATIYKIKNRILWSHM